MLRSVLPLLHQRVDAVSVLKWGLTLGGIYAFTRSISLIAGLLTALFVTEAVDVFKTLPGTDERWAKVGLGGFLLAVSAVWLWGEFRQPTPTRVWIPVAAIAGSLWLLLDARADFVQGRRVGEADEVDDLDGSEVLLMSQQAPLIAEALADGSKTVPELAADCDLTESRVRETTEVAGQNDAIYRVGADTDTDEPRYALDDRKMGLSGIGRQTASGVTTVLRRFVRPFVEQF